jgi:hypothetical protein
MKTLRALAPVLVTGLLAGAAILALLRGVMPAGAHETDEWAAWFRAKGLIARMTSSSAQPARDFAIDLVPGPDGETRNLRNEFMDPDLAATQIRAIEFEYAPNRFKTQVVTFPSAELGARIFASEKRHIVRWSNPRTIHHSVLRVGRHAIIVMPLRDDLSNKLSNAPPELAKRILDAFEERARGLSD